MGSILALFRPSGPLCFPVRQGAFSASGGRAAAATGAAGGFYVSLYKQWYRGKTGSASTVAKNLQHSQQNYCFSRVSEGTLGSFWARFWRCSVLQGHCVSLSGRVRFQPREEEQQQQQEQQEGSMSHYTQQWYKHGSSSKGLVQNYCFSRVSEGTLGTFWARFWRRSVLQGHCVSLSGRVRFQLREEEQQQQQEQQEGSMSHCTNSGIKTGRKLLFF